MKTLNCILFYFLIIKIIGRAWFLQILFYESFENYVHSYALLFQTEGRRCKKGFDNIGNWCFSFHPNGAPFVKSSEICGEIGGEMVVLDSPEKEAMLTDYIEGWSSNKAF